MALFKRKKPVIDPEPMPVPVVSAEPEVPVSEPQPEPSAERKTEPQRRRSENLRLRLTPEELAYLNEQASLAGMSKTDYIMAAAEGSPVIVIDEVPQLLVELRRQGVNLNQLVRLANETHSVDLPELKAAVQHCLEVQTEIMRMCDTWNMKFRKKTETKGE